MDNFEKVFQGRRVMSQKRRLFYIVSGVIEVTIGLFGLFNIDPSQNLFWLFLVLLISGTGYVVIALHGKLLLSEYNYIRIQSGIIEFKNAHRKSNIINADQLDDIIIGHEKAEFRPVGQKMVKYDFSVFPERDRKEIVAALKRLKK